MTNRQQLVELYRRQVCDFLDDRYDETYKRHVRNVLNSDLFPVPSDPAKAAVVQEFIIELMTGMAQEVYYDNKDRITGMMVKEAQVVVENLFTEDEAKQVCDFISTDVGRKLTRNWDIFRDTFSVGNNELVAEIFHAWADPSLMKQINAFAKSLELDEPDDESYGAD
jgi:hypothetical protein